MSVSRDVNGFGGGKGAIITDSRGQLCICVGFLSASQISLIILSNQINNFTDFMNLLTERPRII